MNWRRAVLGLLALTAGFAASGVTTNSPSVAISEGLALAQQLRELRPEANFTNRGTLVIKVAKKSTRRLAFVSRVAVTETNWTSCYEASDGTNQVASFSVEHQPNATNRYVISGTNVVGGAAAAISFAGSDFWLTDLGLDFYHWPEQRLTRREMKRSQSCQVLESSQPKPDPQGYSRVVTWIDADSGAIVQAQAFDANGKLLKEFSPTEVEKINGQWQVKELEIENVRTGSISRLIFDL